MTGLELLAVALRALVYAGSVATAGGVLFALTFPGTANAIGPSLKRQIAGGFILLLLAEPLRYGVFQLSIADGDWTLAFGPDLRWMGFETPIGRAALLRLAAGAVIVFTAMRSKVVSGAAAATVIGSFLLEGHTAANDARLWVAPLLALHLAGVHWWLGALLPLIAVTRLDQPADVIAAVEAFGRQAAWIVAALVAAGAGLTILLTGGHLNPASAYQQRLTLKLALVAALLSIAAVNKLRLTPLLRTDFTIGTQRLRTSIRIETAVALAVLAATA